MSRLATLLILLLSVSMPSRVRAEPPPADELMVASRQTTLIRGGRMTGTLQLISPSGDVRVRKLSSLIRLQADGGFSRIARYEFPADARGLATLLIERDGRDDDLWVYVPALKKVRRLVADSKRDSFMGTVLSYGDVLGHKPAEWRHAHGGDDAVDGRPCWTITSTPADGTVQRASGYSRRESCIDVETRVTLRMRTWDSDGKRLKEIISEDVRPVAGQAGAYLAYRTRAEDFQSGQRTQITVDRFEFVPTLTELDFSPTALGSDE